MKKKYTDEQVKEFMKWNERQKNFERDFNETKQAIIRAEDSIKQGKSFSGNQADFNYWKRVVKETEACIESGGTQKVSFFRVVRNAKSLFVKTCFSQAAEY